MYGVLVVVSLLILPSMAGAVETVCVPNVHYRLVGEDSPAPEKARMVEEQILGVLRGAGTKPTRGDCAAADVPVLNVAVAESGALYDLSITLAPGAVREEQFTGPFAEMLKKTRSLVQEILAETDAGLPADPPKKDPESIVTSSMAAEQAGSTMTMPEKKPEANPDQLKVEVEQGNGDSDGGAAADTNPVERNPLWASSVALTAIGGAALIAGVIMIIVDDPCVEEVPEHGCRTRFDSSAAGIPLAGLGGIAVGVGIAGIVLLEREAPATTNETEAPAAVAAISPLPGGAAGGIVINF